MDAMSDDEVRRAFADLYAMDAEFAEAIASAPSMSRAVSIAAEHGFVVDAAAIRAAVTGWNGETAGAEALDLRVKPTVSEGHRLRY